MFKVGLISTVEFDGLLFSYRADVASDFFPHLGHFVNQNSHCAKVFLDLVHIWFTFFTAEIAC